MRNKNLQRSYTKDLFTHTMCIDEKAHHHNRDNIPPINYKYVPFKFWCKKEWEIIKFFWKIIYTRELLKVWENIING